MRLTTHETKHIVRNVKVRCLLYTKTHLAYSPEPGTSLYLATHDGDHQHSLECNSEVLSISTSANGEHIVGSTFEQISVFDSESGECVRSILRSDAVAAVSPCQKWIACLASTGCSILAFKTGRASKQVETEVQAHLCVAFSVDSEFVAFPNVDHAICVYTVVTAEARHILEGHSHDVRAIQFAPHVKHLFSCSRDNSLLQWCLETGLILHSFPQTLIWCFVLSHDGQSLVSAEGTALHIMDIPEKGNGGAVVEGAPRPKKQMKAAERKDTSKGCACC